MRNIRVGAFETNSSNYHSFVIHIGRYDQISVDCEYEQDDVWLEEGDVDEILYHLPIERLEEVIKQRKEQDAEQELWKEYFSICDQCKNCLQKNVLAGTAAKCQDCNKTNRKIEIYNILYPNNDDTSKKEHI